MKWPRPRLFVMKSIRIIGTHIEYFFHFSEVPTFVIYLNLSRSFSRRMMTRQKQSKSNWFKKKTVLNLVSTCWKFKPCWLSYEFRIKLPNEKTFLCCVSYIFYFRISKNAKEIKIKKYGMTKEKRLYNFNKDYSIL